MKYELDGCTNVLRFISTTDEDGMMLEKMQEELVRVYGKCFNLNYFSHTFYGSQGIISNLEFVVGKGEKKSLI